MKNLFRFFALYSMASLMFTSCSPADSDDTAQGDDETTEPSSEMLYIDVYQYYEFSYDYTSDDQRRISTISTRTNIDDTDDGIDNAVWKVFVCSLDYNTKDKILIYGSIDGAAKELFYEIGLNEQGCIDSYIVEAESDSVTLDSHTTEDGSVIEGYTVTAKPVMELEYKDGYIVKASKVYKDATGLPEGCTVDDYFTPSYWEYVWESGNLMAINLVSGEDWDFSTEYNYSDIAMPTNLYSNPSNGTMLPNGDSYIAIFLDSSKFGELSKNIPSKSTATHFSTTSYSSNYNPAVDDDGVLTYFAGSIEYVGMEYDDSDNDNSGLAEDSIE